MFFERRQAGNRLPGNCCNVLLGTFLNSGNSSSIALMTSHQISSISALLRITSRLTAYSSIPLIVAMSPAQLPFLFSQSL